MAAGASHVTHGHPSPNHLVVGGQYAGPPTSIPSLMITAPPLQHLHHTHTNGQTISHHITQVTGRIGFLISVSFILDKKISVEDPEFFYIRNLLLG